jgi:hypothetical protein
MRDGSINASARKDRLWPVGSGDRGRHQSKVLALCPVTVNGRHLLATASYDRTVRLRIWDPAAAGASLLTIPVHHDALAIAWLGDALAIAWLGDALAIAWLGDALAIGLSADVLVIELRDDLPLR